MLRESTTLIEQSKILAAAFEAAAKEELPAEVTMAHKEKVDTALNPALATIQKLRAHFQAKLRESTQIPAAESIQIKENIAILKQKIDGKDTEIRTLQAAIRPLFMRAQQAIQQKKREEDMKKQAEERARVRDWNAKFYAFTYQMNAVIDSVRKLIMTDDPNVSEAKLREKAGILLGFKTELKTRMEAGKQDVMQQTRNCVQVTSGNVDKMLVSMKNLRAERHKKKEADIRMLCIQVSVEARKQRGAKEKGTYWKQCFGSAAKVLDLRMYQRYVKKFGIPRDADVDEMFRYTCKFISEDAINLSPDDFHLLVVENYYRTVKATTLTETKDASIGPGPIGQPKVEGTKVEADSFVQILEMPVEDTEKKITRVKVKDMASGNVGFCTMTTMGLDHTRDYLLTPFYPHYYVAQDTVLTDTFDMKNFNVVARVKAGDKFRATDLPESLVRETEGGETDTMMRVKGVKPAQPKTDTKDAEPEALGFVTLTGNKGATTLRLMAQPSTAPTLETYTETAFNINVFETWLQDLATNLRENIKKQMRELGEQKDKVLNFNDNLKDVLEKETPDEEEIETIMKDEKVIIAMNSCGTNLRNQLQRLARDCQFVESGPYAALYKDLDDLLKAVNANIEEVEAIKAEMNKNNVLVKNAAAKRKQQKEEEEKAALAETLQEGLSTHNEKMKTLFTTITNCNEGKDKHLLTMKAHELDQYAKELRIACDDASIFLKEYETWLEENKVQSIPMEKGRGRMALPQGPGSIAVGKARGAMNNANYQVRTHKGQISENKWFIDHMIEASLMERLRVDISLALREHAKKQKVTKREDLFEKIVTKGKDVMTIKEFESFLDKKLKLKLPRVESLLGSFGFKDEINKDCFKLLCAPQYRVKKRCLLTDNLEARACKRMRKFEQHDTLEQLEDFAVDTVCDIVRFKCRSLADNMEGFVCVKGNKGSEYLQMQQFGYKVRRPTAMTEGFELETSPKIIRKLRVGEILRCFDLPVLEPKSNLMRIKAVALADDTTGYVTITGNQGTPFLDNVPIPSEIPQLDDLPIPPEVEEKEEEPEVVDHENDVSMMNEKEETGPAADDEEMITGS